MATLSSIITPTNVVTTAPGANGNVLTSNGTAWVSQAPSGGGGAQAFVTMFTGSNTMPTQNSDGFGLI